MPNITMENVWYIIVCILIGALVGWLAGKIMKSKFNMLGNVIIGLLGGALAGWVGGIIASLGTWAVSFILAVVFSCLLIWLSRKLFK